MLGRLIVIIVLLAVPQVHADLIVGEIGSLGGEPSAIAAFDSDSDGVPDAAVVGTVSGAMAFGASSWTIPVGNVYGIAPADFDKNDHMNGVVIAGKDIVAVDHTGQVLWRVENLLGKSAVAFDRDGDGYKDEVVVGCWDRIVAFDSDGESLWNYTEISEKNVMNIVLTEKSIVASAGKMLYFFSFSGNLRAAKAQSNNIVAISPINLEGDGTMNGVVVIIKEGDNRVKINAYTMYGISKEWGISQFHESGVDVSASPIDRYSTGKKENIVINLEGGAYWVNSNGVTAKIGSVYAPGAVAPIDFDGDGVLDDIITSKKGTSKAGGLYAYSAYGQELASYNQTGGVKIVAVDLTFDGKANDAIVATSFDKRVYSVISDVSDSTTSSGTTTTTVPTTTTTLSPQDSATTTLAQAAPGDISVDLGQDRSVVDGAEVALTASATPSTSGGIIVSYIWTESSTVLGQDSTLKKVFEGGIHDVKVEIIDNTGAKANDTVRITVTAAGTGNASVGDSDSDGWTDEFELRMGTDPDKPDTDEDGIIDSKDPNPLVANDKGALSGSVRYLSPLLGVVKWIVIVGVIIIVLIYMREKILDMLWDMRKDGSE